MIKKKILPNKICLYILNDKFFKNCMREDLVIIFNNYGSLLDNKTNIYGMQHLLEHVVFENYSNLNIYSNASTTMEDMSFELFFNKDYSNTDDPCIKFIKKCLFVKNDFSKINLSRKLNDKEIEQYINEIDAEYNYRNTLPIPWDLKSLIFSNNNVIYMGGNKNTLFHKKKEIQNYLKEPEPIPPEDINIYLKKSKIHYLNDIENIFSQIKPIKKEPLKIKVDFDKVYNKIFKINEHDTNHLSFVLNKKDYENNYEVFYVVTLLYPFFDFAISSLDEIFITFFFDEIFILFNFFNILKYGFYDKLDLGDFNEDIIFFFNKYTLNKYFSEDLLEYFFNLNRVLTFSECYKKYKKPILNFFKSLTSLIKNKKYFLNTTKDYIYNEETKVSLEKYLMMDTNILENYFFNKTLERFDIKTFINKLYEPKFRICSSLSCVGKFLIIEKDYDFNFNFNNLRTFSFDVKDGQIIKYINKNNNKSLNYSLYINSLILFFSNPVFYNYKDCLEHFIKEKNLEGFLKQYYNDINIKFSKKSFLIKTGYEFIFGVIKIKKKYIKDLLCCFYNIESYLKQKGITYYLETVCLKFEKFYLVFFFTQTNKERSIKVFNCIKNILTVNYIKNDMIYVLSEKALDLDLNALNKFVKFTV